jgi:tripartite ATP-independent transporter DctM subunit
MARKRNYPVSPRPPLRQVLVSFKNAFLPLMTPVIIIGGILAGAFTPTEAAVIAVMYALFLGMIVYRELTFKRLIQVIHQVGVQTATIMIITATATVLGWMLTRAQIPQLIAEGMFSITTNPYLILLLLNIFLFINGCLMEVIAALVILTPILVPMVKMLGIDPIHFGVVMTLNLMIGLLTPPLGMGLYTVQKVAGISFERMTRAAFPFLLPLIIVLLLITYIPQISLFLAEVIIGP